MKNRKKREKKKLSEIPMPYPIGFSIFFICTKQNAKPIPRTRNSTAHGQDFGKEQSLSQRHQN